MSAYTFGFTVYLGLDEDDLAQQFFDEGIMERVFGLDEGDIILSRHTDEDMGDIEVTLTITYYDDEPRSTAYTRAEYRWATLMRLATKGHDSLRS